MATFTTEEELLAWYAAPPYGEQGENGFDLERFREAVLRLHEAPVRFVIVGDLALCLPGGAQATEGVDVAFARDEQSLVRPAQLHGVRLLSRKTDLGDIGLLPLPEGVDSFDGLWARAEAMDLGASQG